MGFSNTTISIHIITNKYIYIYGNLDYKLQFKTLQKTREFLETKILKLKV